MDSFAFYRKKKRLFHSEQKLYLEYITLGDTKHRLSITECWHWRRFDDSSCAQCHESVSCRLHICKASLDKWTCKFEKLTPQMYRRSSTHSDPIRFHRSTRSKSSFYTQVTLRLYCIDRIHIINMQITSWRHTKIVAILAAWYRFLACLILAKWWQVSGRY